MCKLPKNSVKPLALAMGEYVNSMVERTIDADIKKY